MASASPAPRASGSSVRPTVLVIDDVDATRSGLAELLRLRGYDSYEAKDGRDGITRLRDRPDTRVVVLDLAMPETNGFWFREQQLKDPMLAQIPVIVFTGSGKGDHLQPLDVADVLLKPFAVDDLLEAVERHSAAPPNAPKPVVPAQPHIGATARRLLRRATSSWLPAPRREDTRPW